MRTHFKFTLLLSCADICAKYYIKKKVDINYKYIYIYIYYLYFHFFALVSRTSAALSSVTQHAMPPKKIRQKVGNGVS